MTIKHLAFGALIAIAAIHAVLGYVAQDAMLSLSALSFTGMRFLFGAVPLLPVALTTRRLPSRGALQAGLGVGVVLMLGLLSQNMALQMENAGRVTFFTMLRLIVAPLSIWLMRRRRPALTTNLGIAITLIGAFVLLYTPNDGHMLADILSILSAVAFGIGAVLLNDACAKHDWRWIALIQVGCISLFSLLASLGTLHLAQLTPTVLRDLLFAGVVATSLTYALEAWAITKMKAVVTTTVLSLEAPFTVLLAIPLGLTLPGAQGAAGCLIIFAGTCLVAASAPAQAVPALALPLLLANPRTISAPAAQDG